MLNGGQAPTLNILLVEIGNCVAVNSNLCNNLAVCKLKSLCCRPLLFSTVSHFMRPLMWVSLQRLVVIFSSNIITQLHYLVCHWPFAVFICCLIFTWHPLRDGNHGWCFLFCFDRQLYSFQALGLIAPLTACFLCAGLSLKPETQRLILTRDKRSHAVLLQARICFSE